MGSGFASGMTVTFGATPATSIVVTDEGHATCLAPIGTGTVAVTIAVAGQSSTLPAAYTYVPRPTIASVSPTSGTSLGGVVITVTGTNFLPGAAVTVGGTPATEVQVVSATQLTARTPAHAAGAVAVAVTNPFGQVRPSPMRSRTSRLLGPSSSPSRQHPVPRSGAPQSKSWAPDSRPGQR